MLDPRSVQSLGFRDGDEAELALEAATALAALGHGKQATKRQLKAVRNKPRDYLDDPLFGKLARALQPAPPTPDAITAGEALRPQPVPHRVWGEELLDGPTLAQFDRACRLPVAVQGAQMPDGHIGYGLPIGGVLATDSVVIPYAVGVDIACRMRLTVVDEPLALLDEDRGRFRSALRRETRFGVGAGFESGERRRHEVMDDDAWREVKLLADLKDRAWEQLGSSGSGNHFVEFGELEVYQDLAELSLSAGTYLSLLSHSGSRGLGARIADHYTKVARAISRLPKEAQELAWLSLDSEAGEEYWRAMNLAGRYAAANHELIHRHVLENAGLEKRTHAENHHNFAWKETYGDRELIVHRKGATPAGEGVLGVIPGSMGDPGYVVRGKGNPQSLNSAAHGAGRVMSRNAAKRSLTREQMRDYLAAREVELLDAGLDESPQVYKPIEEVMRAQDDLVERVAEFRPKLVLMARGGRAED